MRKAYVSRAILAIKDHDAATAIETVVNEAGVDVVGRCTDGAAALDMLYKGMPDFLICDIVMQGLDAYGVLEMASRTHIETMPAMIVLSIGGMELHEKRLLDRGVYRVFQRPVSAEALKSALVSVEIGDRIAPKGITQTRVRELLWSLGLNPRLAGSAYLTTAILLTSKDVRLAEELTTKLYPMVGGQYGVDGRCVERCMRRSIESAWSTGALRAQHDLFGDSIDEQRGKPTCSELIVRVTDFLKLKEWKTYDKASGGYRA